MLWLIHSLINYLFDYLKLLFINTFDSENFEHLMFWMITTSINLLQALEATEVVEVVEVVVLVITLALRIKFKSIKIIKKS